MGAVAGLRYIKNAVGVAKAVLQRTTHSMLVGGAGTQSRYSMVSVYLLLIPEVQQSRFDVVTATDFGIEMGFEAENLTSDSSADRWQQWLDNDCQPNYWQVNQWSETCHFRFEIVGSVRLTLNVRSYGTTLLMIYKTLCRLQNVVPDATSTCGPYTPADDNDVHAAMTSRNNAALVSQENHDTIGKYEH